MLLPHLLADEQTMHDQLSMKRSAIIGDYLIGTCSRRHGEATRGGSFGQHVLARLFKISCFSKHSVVLLLGHAKFGCANNKKTAWCKL